MNLRGTQPSNSSAPYGWIGFKQWNSTSERTLLESLRGLYSYGCCLWGDSFEARHSWNCQPYPLHVASLTRWSQGSWTVYMVAGFPQSKSPKETRWQYSPSIILLVRSKSQAGPTQGRWVGFHILMAEWHSHIVEDHVRWDILLWPSLENIIAALRSNNSHIHKEKEVSVREVKRFFHEQNIHAFVPGSYYCLSAVQVFLSLFPLPTL